MALAAASSFPGLPGLMCTGPLPILPSENVTTFVMFYCERDVPEGGGEAGELPMQHSLGAAASAGGQVGRSGSFGQQHAQQDGQ